MTNTRRQFIGYAGTSALAWASMCTEIRAAETARITVGFPAGSSADALSRLTAQKLASTGTAFIVENRTGAGGRLGPDWVRRSAPDGKNLLVTPDVVMTLYPSTYKSLTYDPIKDFRAVTTLSTVPMTLVVGAMVPASVTNLAQFADWCKKNPERASFGTSGAGTSLHLIGAMFARKAKFELTHVPYRGANVAAQDVSAGQIAAAVAVLSDVLPLVQGGKLRVLGITTQQRNHFVPEAATFTEQGYAELEGYTWYGLFAPRKTPETVVNELNAAVAKAFAQADVVDFLATLGMEPHTMSAENFAILMKTDTERWAKVAKEIGYEAVD